MAVTIENVESRTLLEQFHSLYENQQEQQTALDNLDTKIDNETIDRQTADLNINAEIDTLREQIESLGVLFTYKGEVATIQDLPAENNKLGDVWYVDSEQAGYIWLEKNGVAQWEEFGPAIDLSEYAKQEDLEQLQDDVDAMNTQVETNASNIVSLTNSKQDKLTAGTNITIDADNVISASGGGSAPENMVTTDTKQEITNYKVFRGSTKAGIAIVGNLTGLYGYGIFHTGTSGLFIDCELPLNNFSNSSKLIKINYNSTAGGSCVLRFDRGTFVFPRLTTDSTYRTIATTQDILDKVPDAPDTDGTYTLKCVVSNGVKTYQWVLDA